VYTVNIFKTITIKPFLKLRYSIPLVHPYHYQQTQQYVSRPLRFHLVSLTLLSSPKPSLTCLPTVPLPSKTHFGTNLPSQRNHTAPRYFPTARPLSPRHRTYWPPSTIQCPMRQERHDMKSKTWNFPDAEILPKYSIPDSTPRQHVMRVDSMDIPTAYQSTASSSA
jgi:hypothetical protein